MVMNNRLLEEQEIADMIEGRNAFIKDHPDAVQTGTEYMMIAKVQDAKTLNSLLKWLDEPCFYHPKLSKTRDHQGNILYVQQHEHRYLCPSCIKEIYEDIA